jgi:hypothetical protein
MPVVPLDAQLQPHQSADPVRWLVSAPSWPGCVSAIRGYLTSRDFRGGPPADDELAPYLPRGRSRTLRSFGHDEEGVHWLLTRGGTALHTDPAYARYSHQLVLRNDGNRIRGLTDDEASWHPPMVPGTLYALDTHSPHQGTPDVRMISPHYAGAGPPVIKLVIAVDRNELLTASEAWVLLKRLLGKPFPEAGQTGHAAPRWHAS